MTLHRLVFAALALAIVSVPASALDFTMDFDDIPVAVGPPPPPDQSFGSAVLGFYNNDPVYQRTGRQALDVTFSDEALSICSSALERRLQGQLPAAAVGRQCGGVGVVQQLQLHASRRACSSRS